MNSRYLFGTLTSFREQKWAFMVGRSHPMPLECGLMWLYGIFPFRNHNIKQKNMLVGSPHKKIWLSKRTCAQGHTKFWEMLRMFGFLFYINLLYPLGLPKNVWKKLVTLKLFVTEQLSTHCPSARAQGRP